MFCGVKKNYKYLQRFSTETWKCYTVQDFCKYEKLEYKKNRLKLDIDFLNT